MNSITLKLEEMSTIYKELEDIAKKSFASLKTKKFEEQKMNQLEEQKKLKELSQRTLELRELIEKSSPKGEILRLREYIAQVDSQEDREKLETSAENLLMAESSLKEQIKMNIEIAAAMRDVHTMKVEAAIDIVKKDNEGNTGPVMFDEDY